jgi:MFS family permease
LAEPSLHCKSSRQIEQEFNSSQTSVQTCDMWSNYTASKEHYDCKFVDPHYDLTLINDWNLICDKRYLPSLTQTIFFIGALCSAFSGMISDCVGRQRVLRLLVLIQTCCIVVNHLLVTNSVPFVALDVSIRFVIYCVYQFAVGFLTTCIIMTCIVLLVELTVDKYHNLVTIVVLVFFGLGEIILAFAFFVTKNWKLTNLFICFYSIVNCVSFWLCVPESPRWLAAIKQFDEPLRV